MTSPASFKPERLWEGLSPSRKQSTSLSLLAAIFTLVLCLWIVVMILAFRTL